VSFLVAQGLLIEDKQGRTKILSITASGKDVVWYHMKIERELVQTRKAAPTMLFPSIKSLHRR